MNTIVWKPKNPQASRMWEFMRFVEQKEACSCKNYQELYAWSIKEPTQFWQKLIDYFGLTFQTQADEVLNDYDEMINARWFQGATFNFAEQLLKRRDEHPALISINEITNVSC